MIPQKLNNKFSVDTKSQDNEFVCRKSTQDDLQVYFSLHFSRHSGDLFVLGVADSREEPSASLQ